MQHQNRIATDAPQPLQLEDFHSKISLDVHALDLAGFWHTGLDATLASITCTLKIVCIGNSKISEQK